MASCNGVRPFVELSFMPKKLASKEIIQGILVQTNVAPPKDWAKWDDLIPQFTRHLIDRYGIDESANGTSSLDEPNLDFWGGSQPGRLTGSYTTIPPARKSSKPEAAIGGPQRTSRMGRRFHSNIAPKKCARRLRLRPMFRQRQGAGHFGTSENIPRDAMSAAR